MAENTLYIRTDKKWKPFKYSYQVPRRTLKKSFDWIDTENEEHDGFFKYKNQWYHLSEFETTRIPGWDGQHPFGFFSGLLIKVSSDGERYKIGYYYQ